MANTHRLLAARDCEYYRQRLMAVDTKFDQLLESLKAREQKLRQRALAVLLEVAHDANEIEDLAQRYGVLAFCADALWDADEQEDQAVPGHSRGQKWLRRKAPQP